MATIKAYTDLEQSKRLAEILPLKSADMKILPFTEREYRIVPINDISVCGREDEICAWSLAALLNILPYPQLSKDRLGSEKVGWMVSVYPNDCRHDSCWHDNPVDACVDMIIKLNEIKMML